MNGRSFPDSEAVAEDSPRNDVVDESSPAARSRLTNLPSLPRAFVGRSRELKELRRSLDRGQLLTLTGPGGVGKTRLAIELAKASLRDYADGAWLVDLSGLSERGAVTPTVAAILGIPEEPGYVLIDTIASALAERTLLLILDNCEHVLDPVADLTNTILPRCPGVRVLATSREPLATGDETVWQVPPLSLPASDASSERIARSDAVRLFVERAGRAQPGYALRDADAALVAQLCRRLDGLPLGIELAAARMRALPVAELAQRLDPALLRAARAGTARHRSLDAAIAWSYELLDEEERTLFSRLAVFAGTFGLDAASAVCGEEGRNETETLGVLSRLVDKSMVVPPVAADGGARYRLLDTLRGYAAAHLQQDERVDEIRSRHLHYYTDLARTARRGYEGPQAGRWLDSLHDELDNLRAAFHWALTNDHERALLLAASLGRFFSRRGHFGEGRRWLQEALDRPGGSLPARAQAFGEAGDLAFREGDYPRAISSLNTCVELRRQLGDLDQLVRALWHRAWIASMADQPTLATGPAEEALAVAERSGDETLVALGHAAVGLRDLCLGRPPDTRRLQEIVEVARQRGAPEDLAHALQLLSLTALLNGELERARIAQRERLEVWTSVGGPDAHSLEVLAMVAAAEGDAVRAMRLQGAADASRDRTGYVIPPLYSRLLDRSLQPAKDRLGPAAARAFEEGRRASAGEAVDYGLGKAVWPARRAGPWDLTPRELEVVGLVGEGLTNREIAARLGLSDRTVDAHLDHIRTKLGLRKRAQIAAWAAHQASDATPDRD